MALVKLNITYSGSCHRKPRHVWVQHDFAGQDGVQAL